MNCIVTTKSIWQVAFASESPEKSRGEVTGWDTKPLVDQHIFKVYNFQLFSNWDIKNNNSNF